MTVVGIGADGWAGLSPEARGVLRVAPVVFGSRRQLADLPVRTSTSVTDDGLPPGARRIEWPSPLLPALPGLLAEHVEGAAPGGVCVLASGDPMYYGIGVTLVRLLGAARVRVVAHPSSVSLACARLGWASQDVDVVSVVGRALDQIRLVLAPGRRMLVLSADRSTPAAVAALLVDSGYGASALTVLSRLGASDEDRQVAGARHWASADSAAVADLNIIAVEAVLEPDGRYLPRVPGLPDDAFEHDGQITKREIRALTLARLAPAPGELLWDVGAGSGSVAIEWLRTHAHARAIAIEPRPERAERIRRNAARLGVPHLRVVDGRAPRDLAALPRPDAIFVGGGVSAPGVLEACWTALHADSNEDHDRDDGGGRGRWDRRRLVVNAVTLESETVLAEWYARCGGELVRLAVSRASPVGGFTGWRPAMPVTQWTVWPAAHRPVS